MLRRCDVFMLDEKVVAGVSSGHVIWVVPESERRQVRMEGMKVESNL